MLEIEVLNLIFWSPLSTVPIMYIPACITSPKGTATNSCCFGCPGNRVTGKCSVAASVSWLPQVLIYQTKLLSFCLWRLPQCHTQLFLSSAQVMYMLMIHNDGALANHSHCSGIVEEANALPLTCITL